MNFIVSWVLELFKKPEFTVTVEPTPKAKPAVKKAATKRTPAAKKAVKKPVKKVK
jgi:hypothetical protein